MSRIRLGKISYSNMWPITHFFDESIFAGEVDFIEQVPNQLNKKMAMGEIDIGAISSFAYAENADNYLILPNLSVSCYGAIGSISLYHKLQIPELNRKQLALTNTSLTSVNLLRIILEEFHNIQPTYITMAPIIDEMMKNAEAALLIGDEALLASLRHRKKPLYHHLDLGSEWQRLTGQWMVFAVYAVRKETYFKNPELVERIYREYLNSKARGYQQITEIIAVARQLYGSSNEFWQRYFARLSHDLSSEQQDGLRHYYRLAKKIGALTIEPELGIIDFQD